MLVGLRDDSPRPLHEHSLPALQLLLRKVAGSWTLYQNDVLAPRLYDREHSASQWAHSVNCALILLQVRTFTLLSPLCSIDSCCNLNEVVWISSCPNGVNLSLCCHHTSKPTAHCTALLADALQVIIVFARLFPNVQTDIHLKRRESTDWSSCTMHHDLLL